MMKLSSKKTRYIAYLLLLTMVFQSFAPYAPIIKVKISEEKIRIKEEIRRKDATITEKHKPEKETKFSDFSINPQIEVSPSFSTATEYSSALKEGEIGLLAGKSFDNPEDNVFQVYMEQAPKEGQQLYLSYELYGVSDKSGVSRSINDRISRGGYIVKTNTQWTHQRELIHSDWIHQGENLIYFTVPENATYGYKIKNLKLEVENKEVQDKDMIIESYAYKGGDTYVRGFISDNKSEEVKINGEKVSLYQGEFETLLSGVVEEVEIEVAGKKSKKTTILTIGQQDYKYSVDLNISQKQEFFKKVNSQNKVSFLGAEIEVTGTDLISDQLFSVQNLRSRDLPALDMGLQNVTAKAKGYRFLPHGEHFTEGAVVKIAYDRAKIPSGYTEQDIRTYYFDLESRHWVALKRDSVDIKNQVIISRTTHFTDMINGVIQAPESPETAGFTPTMMSDIKVADPLAKVNLISPPSVNNRGSAGMGYSFEMPPARNGMSPSLGIQYNSDGGSGWLGEEWDLNVPGISVDTRWGVPRYDNALETETYLMEGSQLVTKDPKGNSSIAHRGEKISRTSDRFFYPRKEGSFSKIQRKGNSPTNYIWEVTDRKGTKYTYGGNGGVVKGSFTNAKGISKEVIAEWKLSRIEEVHGDWIEYHYDQLDESISGSLFSKAIYLREVRAGNKGEEPHTKVIFTRGQDKQKQTSSARYGYLTSQNALLSRVEINFEGSKLREYTFEYKAGAFYTDLLDRVVHRDNEGKEFSSNTLKYYDDVRSEEGYIPFKSEDVLLSKDNILGVNSTSSYGGSFYTGIGVYDGDSQSKSGTIGGSFNYTRSITDGESIFIDINGDGLPDRVYRENEGLYYQPNITLGIYPDKKFGNPIKIEGVKDFSRVKNNNYSGGARAIVGYKKATITTTIGRDRSNSKSSTPIYFSDVNNDGLIDIVYNSKVYFNQIKVEENGDIKHRFTLESKSTPSPIFGGGVIDDSDTEVDKTEQEDLIKHSPLYDVVRVWEAPFNGKVKIEGSVQLQLPKLGYDSIEYEKSDGVRMAIQFKGSEIWEKRIQRDDTSVYAANSVIRDSIKKGEKIYFRVQSGNEIMSNGAFDQVKWNPTVSYVGSKVNHTNADGQGTYVFTATEAEVASQDVLTRITAFSTAEITGRFVKPITSDDITLKIIQSNDKDEGGNEENYIEKVIYEEVFAWDKLYDGPINIKIPTDFKGENLQFLVSSKTNVAWNKVKWTPEIKVDDEKEGEGTLGIVNYSIYNQFTEGSYYSLSAPAQLTIKPELFPAKDVSVAFLNGDMVVSLKSSRGLISKQLLSIVNGKPKNAMQAVNVSSAADIWIEGYIVPNNSVLDVNSAKIAELRVGIEARGETINENKTIVAAVFATKEEEGFGHMYRNWGQFIYNANNDGRYGKPMSEIELELPKDKDAKLDPLEMVFIPMSLDASTKSHWAGADKEVYINGELMSSSRLGEKDVILTNPLEGLGGSIGSSAIGIKLESSAESSTNMVSAGVGIGLTKSISWGTDKSITSFSDMNGDGYPDIITRNLIQFTNTQGGFDGEIIGGNAGHGGIHSSASDSETISIGGNPVHTYSILAKQKTAEKKANQATEGLMKALSAVEVNFAKPKSEDNTEFTLMDVNGDGLPDKVYKDDKIQLNLGYRFSEPVQWGIKQIQESKTKTTNVGIGAGGEIAKVKDYASSSISGGIGLTTTTSNSQYSFIDVNSDGLVDMVRVKGDKVFVTLNRGYSFAINEEEIEWSGLSKINESASENFSANFAYTFSIKVVLPPSVVLKIPLTPGASVGTSSSFSFQEIKDVDGDGFPDIVFVDDSGSTYYKKSTIARTNKLQKVSNSIGGSFTLDYARTAATYDHPGGKWALSSLEMNDGIKDDGSNTRVEYVYSKGKHDRHEREFLGFGKVETLSIDTENSNQIYRKSIEEYDVSDYYKAGNHLKSTVEDATGNKYAETLNKYYHYEVKQIDSKNYSITNTELNLDNQSAYTPLKYTQSMVYEGTPTGMIANESHYIYDINDQYGELKSYRYSDKGSLGENGNGSYNYETGITYTSNSSNNIYGLPKEVKVSGNDGKLYRHVKAEYDTNYANHLTRVSQVVNESGEEAVTDIVYDNYGNIIRKTLPANIKGERMWYTYRYDRKYSMYLERIDDAYGYTSELENYDYRYGIPLSNKDYNGYYMETVIDNLGRVSTITGPNEMELGLPYTIKFEYQPVATVSEGGEITQPAYAVTKHYDPQHKGDDIETVSFVDGVGRALQVKKDGVITQTDENGSNPKDEKILIVSGRNKLDAFGRVIESYYPITEDLTNKLVFNKTFDGITPTRTQYDILDRALKTTLPDNSSSTAAYSLDTSGRNLVTILTDAMGGEQATHTSGSGLTIKTEQLSGPNGTITTSFAYDLINQLLEVTDTEGQKTLSTYDMGGRRTEVNHPSAGVVKLTYDALGNVLSRQTSNLAEKGELIEYKYQYNRLTNIIYPRNPQNNVNYYYGGKNAKENRIGRLILQEDGTGAQEFKYGTLGELTEVRRTVIIPNQAIATYVTKTKYDSWNRIEQIIYPDEEKVEYTYNTAGLLTGVKGSKAYSYDYVNKIGYDKFEQRNYLKYCNGAETTYTYDPQRRRMTDLQVWTNGSSQGARRQVMNNKYSYDAISNILSVSNEAPLPQSGQSNQGGQMKHEYGYDGLYRLTQATGSYIGADNKSAGYKLDMGYDNLHNITTKKQHLNQQNIMFDGGLNVGYDLAYTYDKTKKNQIQQIEDTNYRTEEAKPEEKREEEKAYTYDANGNLIYINTALKKKDNSISDKTGERKLSWDEENRLKAIDDNGFVSSYWYDASGERVVKSSGESEQVYVNALFAGGTTSTSNFTAYISPYLVVSPNGKYTKHYYIGSQRIVSKLGDIESFGADPRRIEYAGDNLDGISINWKEKYEKGIQDIRDNYGHFEVPYDGKDNDDYINGKGFCCISKEESPQTYEAGIGTGNVEYEKMQYYYHSDHLGSSSYITNLDGEVVQHIEYVPFGEVFLEERNNSWNTPYLFNAKELDEETGLYYYGARYYDPSISLWLSVDR